MLELSSGLSPAALAALRGLEARTVAADGGRLKLEWASLTSRAGDRVQDVLFWEGDELVGFTGLYSFSQPDVELAGMVDPSRRRRGIGTAMLDAAVGLCRERAQRQMLLVTPRTTDAGRLFATSRGAVLEHSEYALVMTGDPAAVPADPRITLRRAEQTDVPAVAGIMKAAFGWSPPDVADRLHEGTDRTLIIERDGLVVGTVRISLETDPAGETKQGGVYGFAVEPAWQGQGIGRDVLSRVCRQLRAEGASRVGLEVAVDNPAAVGLYTSLGFRPVSTEDYYALPD